MMTNKLTLAAPVSFSGIGVHTNLESFVTIHPETKGGIRFLKNGVTIPALFENLESCKFAINLRDNGETVKTVEHFLSALTSSGIWDATIELKGEEMPILDGSAAPIINEISSVGLDELENELAPVLINEEFFAEDEGRSIKLEYNNRFFIDVTIDYLHPEIRLQKWSGYMNSEIYASEIAYARTFGFLKDEKLLKAKNFALGASLENSVIFDEHTVMNEMGLRIENEPARHKVVDLLGDLALLGRPISGRITSFKGGHELSMKLLKRLWGRIR